jgi:serine/threonine protein kinase
MNDITGKVLDRKYKLVRLIGQGGMGSIWEARHTRIHRRVAVKVMHPALGSNTDTVERFFREAQAASAIGHPNIIEIFDVGMEKDGTAFMVMELLDGATVEALLKKQGSIPAQRVIGIVLQVLSALHAAHKKGIVHRDLKPDNVFLAVDSRMREDVKLLDFGIAKILANEDEDLKLTQPGTVLGTPYYLSPEQARGAKDVDHRIDIWAVGVMMFEMLSGRLPFQGDTYNEVIGNILTAEPPLLEQFVTGIPRNLEAILAKAMCKDRERRYSAVSDMLKELMPLYDGVGMGTRSAKAIADSIAPPPFEEEEEAITEPEAKTLRIPKGLVRWRRWVMAGAAGLVACGILLAWWIGSTRETATAPPVSLTAAEQAGAQTPDEILEEQDDSQDDELEPAPSVEIRFVGLPPQAKVYVDDELVSTPISLSSSDKPRALKVVAPGYLPFFQTFVPLRDQTIEIEMRPRTPSKRRSKSKGATTPQKPGWRQNPFG